MSTPPGLTLESSAGARERIGPLVAKDQGWPIGSWLP
jgi:hypothetical protein